MLKANFQNKLTEAGCDEAGRGCLAGPVFAAAVIFPKKFRHKLLNDSKQLTEKERDQLRPVIEKEALSYGVAMIDNLEIDSINILKASFMAMHKALDTLQHTPGLLLIDGNRFIPYRTIPHQCIIEGDAKYMSIAAASVLAKTYRDAYMEDLHKLHPEYEWNRNKGYATAQHRKVIAEIGISPYHRKSFRLLPDQLELTFD